MANRNRYLIGFVDTQEIRPGIWEEGIVERKYRGDLKRSSIRYQTSQETTNENVTISNYLSIVSDRYALRHIENMRYIVVRGTKWKIESVDPTQYPRLLINVGGIYNA